MSRTTTPKTNITYRVRHEMIIHAQYPFDLARGEDVFALAREQGVPGQASVTPLDNGAVRFNWETNENRVV